MLSLLTFPIIKHTNSSKQKLNVKKLENYGNKTKIFKIIIEKD